MTGRQAKGNGSATDVGFYLEKITMYMDVVVNVTDVYNRCSIDYFFEKFGKSLTSLSGFLDLLTNFFWRFFGDSDQQLYKDISNGIDNGDGAAVGLNMGKFLKILTVTEIPAITEALSTQKIISVHSD